MPHRPGADRVVPTATYRLQIEPDFGFAEAAEQVDYLAALGVSHAYLSPVLQAAEGSTHGYDVVDHSRVSPAVGGRKGLERLSRKLRKRDLGLVVDVVPNHMTIPVPVWHNEELWDVLRHGPQSRWAKWFDIEWASGPVVLPILGAPLDTVVQERELVVADDGGRDRDERVLRYYDHELPLAPGTEEGGVEEIVAAQHYRLAYWREGGRDLNYRRFFDVASLIAVRVEDEEVFDDTHHLLLDLMQDGVVDALRIDHPDGLADPAGYLARLADRTGDAWVVAEKILEGEEKLPEDWRCSGTTGYDALMRIGGLFVDPRGEAELTRTAHRWTGITDSLDEVVERAKAYVVKNVLPAELARLVRSLVLLCPEHPEDSLRRALRSLLAEMERYRAYVVPGTPAPEESVAVVDAAYRRAKVVTEKWDRPALKSIRQIVLDQDPHPSPDPARRALLDDVIVRFQQTCGPVMAKGVEDTAFYRYLRLTALNEVGGDPDRFGIPVEEVVAHFQEQLATWPVTMTALSTHDTKRSEDVRARLMVLSERAEDWTAWVDEAGRLAAQHHGRRLDGATEYLLWQTLVGAWPIDGDRLRPYLLKAIREAKLHTAWVDGDESYEQQVLGFADAVLGDPGIVGHVERWVAESAPAARANTLGQKLLQLVLPGVPDVYQGTEVVDLSLVDPDNRRPVDYARRRELLERLDAGERPNDLDAEKLLVTSRALRLRREHAKWFTGPKAMLDTLETGSEHAVAIVRGGGSGPRIVAVASRLAHGLDGYGTAAVELPDGRWRSLLDDRVLSGRVPLSDLLTELPVALLQREQD